MKKNILLLASICLSCLSFAQKAPKKSFSTEMPVSAYDAWESGDMISLPEGGDSLGVVYTAEKADGKTYFWGRGACRTEEGNWAALYPASALRKWDDKTLYFTIPHVQTAVKADRPMYSRTQTPALEFKPLTAYLKFTLSSSLPPVKEIRFVANKYISGSYKADMDARNVSVLLDVGERFREIVLKPQDGGVIAPGDYVMSIFARVLPDGLTVEVETVDGIVASEKINRELKFTLGKERDLGVIRNLNFPEASTSSATDYPQTEAGKILKSELVPSIVDVVWDTTYTVANGLQYYQMAIVTDRNEKMDLYLLKADPSKDVDVRVAWSNECTPSLWVRQTPAQMAAHMDSPTKPVYAIVNADFCENRIPIRPRGPMHCDGKILADSYSIDPRFQQQALSYVGVTYEGKMVIGHNRDYPAAQKTLKECTGAGVILIEDSQIQGGYVVSDKGRDPRTALGYTSDNIVWILAVDGRHKGTEGMTYLETAHVFHGLGCISAVNLDGGGSTQMLVKDPQSGEINMCNWPSDPTNGLGGRERPRLNGWVIMKR